VWLAGKGKEDEGTVWRLSGADEDGRGVLGSVLGEQPPRTPGDGVEKKFQALGRRRLWFS
jgi:hypothetical protein